MANDLTKRGESIFIALSSAWYQRPDLFETVLSGGLEYGDRNAAMQEIAAIMDEAVGQIIERRKRRR